VLGWTNQREPFEQLVPCSAVPAMQPETRHERVGDGGSRFEDWMVVDGLRAGRSSPFKYASDAPRCGEMYRACGDEQGGSSRQRAKRLRTKRIGRCAHASLYFASGVVVRREPQPPGPVAPPVKIEAPAATPHSPQGRGEHGG
jgi:hypothetical protein